MPSSELDSMDLNQRRNSSLYNLTQLSYLTSKYCIFTLYCLTLFIFCVHMFHLLQIIYKNKKNKKLCCYGLRDEISCGTFISVSSFRGYSYLNSAHSIRQLTHMRIIMLVSLWGCANWPSGGQPCKIWWSWPHCMCNTASWVGLLAVWGAVCQYCGVAFH